MTNLDSIKKQKHHFADKGLCSQSYGFSSMYVCESWTVKKAEHWKIDGFKLVLENTLESPLDCKIKPVISEGNQSWIFFRGTDTEAETLILLPPDAKSQLNGKYPDTGKD